MSITEGALTLSPEGLTHAVAPALLSCATAVPPRRFSQEEAFHLCGYSSSRIRQIFLNSDIDSRHFWLDPATFTPQESPDQRHARYLEGARSLAALAARRALDQAGLAAEDVDCILVASCTGYLCPDLSTLLVSELGLRCDVQRGALLGHGCAGALPLLQRASDHARANPGSRVLAVAVEICSACYFFDSSMETIIGNAICADGAAAFVLFLNGHSAAASNSNGIAPLSVLAFQSVLDPTHLDKVGFEHRDGTLRIVLASEIRNLAGPIISRCLDSLLLPRGLRREDIRFWVLHPGGRKVLDAASEFLRLAENDLRFSRRVLREFGNMSSPTALFVLDQVRASGEPQPGDYGVLLALGPGFAAEAALLRW
ncbi:MAG: type III polyketide synthase [Acidobacteria bacterium]|nr:type III polyketide synthase [Acidobacteriota bacterium]MCL5288332.1 type III polyketide synthase [Acidobacteriota bacterium]